MVTRKNFTARRVEAMEASGIRKIFDQAATLKDPINLSIGQPDYDVSPQVKDAACAAIRSGFNKYAPSGGIPELKSAVLEDARKRRGVVFEDAVICAGVSGGLTAALLALLDPGDEVLIPDPYFVSYRHLTALCGGVPVFYDTYPDFRPAPEQIESRLTDKTKALIVMSPANPTGCCWDERARKAVAEMARNKGLAVISDEIYERFYYGDDPAGNRSFAAHYPEGTVCLGGLSKTGAMPGWRLGWACGPREIVAAMTKVQQFTFVCANTPAQKAAVTALREDPTPHVRDYLRKRDFMLAGLREAGFEAPTPEGAFYLFVRIPRRHFNASTFVQAALAKNLLLVPGGVFSRRDEYFRVSYAATDADLERALPIFAELNR
jgi:aspartate aminotransferase/aminotransferase